MLRSSGCALFGGTSVFGPNSSDRPRSSRSDSRREMGQKLATQTQVDLSFSTARLLAAFERHKGNADAAVKELLLGVAKPSMVDSYLRAMHEILAKDGSGALTFDSFKVRGRC